ncbi:IS1096 element passenger TnpR family protein [Serratia fonticola]|uniref:IS1096 element passenger TnpR family protein n=1 Tax=Serratia fonticola TaxID=47917 RepID=UPI0024746C22|nr:hypothetical protein [Serratia fonticola]
MTTFISFTFMAKITVSHTKGGVGFPDNPFRVVIDDFAFDVGDRFTYEYNFFEHWLHDIRVEAIHGVLRRNPRFFCDPVTAGVVTQTTG